MSNTQHTLGPWTVEAPRHHVRADSALPTVGHLFYQNDKAGIPYAERKANARLIAEAGTVATETGLTPRQLADQRAELLEALENLVSWICDKNMTAAEVAIAKARGEA